VLFSWIHSAVFVLDVALQNKFSLSNKFSRNLGIQKMSTCVLTTLRKCTAESVGISCACCWGSMAFTANCCCPSSQCIHAQKFVSELTELNHTVHRGCWTATRVCTVTTPLHSPYESIIHS